jgi:tetratricopeptide (TPR) repeat protein
VATSLNNLAGLYYDQGKLQEALPLYQRALAISEKALEPDQADVVIALTKYAAALRQLGRDTEAEALVRRVAAAIRAGRASSS